MKQQDHNHFQHRFKLTLSKCKELSVK